MDKVLKFLKDAETYYLATVEGDQPRVRPFGTAHVFEGKLSDTLYGFLEVLKSQRCFKTTSSKS